MIRPVVVAISAGAITFGAAAGAVSLVGLAGPSEGPQVETLPELPQPATEGMATAEAKREAAMAFVTDMRGWTSCIAREAPLHDESTGVFDPVATCGAKPVPTLPDEDGNGGQPEGTARGATGAGGEEFGRGVAEDARPDFAGQP